jgi:N-acetylmuramoyl-L-alanine amidase
MVFSFIEYDNRANPVVVIDVGHGGKSASGTEVQRTLSSANNATSPGGLKEKDLTLELALEIQRQIRLLCEKDPTHGLDCILTRSTDANPDFLQRALICGEAKPAPKAIISIHFNASQDHRALGTVAMIGDRNQNSNYENDLRFAEGITVATTKSVSIFLPESRARAPITDIHLHTGKGSNFFFQLQKIPYLREVPKCFLEVEFIDRSDVEKDLLTNRQETFPAIAKSIALWLNDRFGSK